MSFCVCFVFSLVVFSMLYHSWEVYNKFCPIVTDMQQLLSCCDIHAANSVLLQHALSKFSCIFPKNPITLWYSLFARIAKHSIVSYFQKPLSMSFFCLLCFFFRCFSVTALHCYINMKIKVIDNVIWKLKALWIYCIKFPFMFSCLKLKVEICHLL